MIFNKAVVYLDLWLWVSLLAPKYHQYGRTWGREGRTAREGKQQLPENN